MYPHERSLVQHYEGRPFSIIGVNSDSESKLAEIEESNELTWRSFAAGRGGGQIADDWGVQAWPTIFIIDDRGVIRAMNVRGQALEYAIESLVLEAEWRAENSGSAVRVSSSTNSSSGS